MSQSLQKPVKGRSHRAVSSASGFLDELAEFADFGTKSICAELKNVGSSAVPVFINEFWTAKQRDAHSLHEISYRACFKPQLPRFFIERLTQSGDIVYDPFMGRGTTVLEAALLGRVGWATDINPLSLRLVRPRLRPPTLEQIEERLAQIEWQTEDIIRIELAVFYEATTLREIHTLRQYYLSKLKTGSNDYTDDWIQMVATNRLTGHSPGFFSIYTLPPNQAVSIGRQTKINFQRRQTTTYRDVRKLIIRKSKALLKDITDVDRNCLTANASKHRLFTNSADSTPTISSSSVDLAVTSPPFLDTVDYAADNWLRCWFNGMEPEDVAIWKCRKVEDWEQRMRATFKELFRICKSGGWTAFEVGEVRKGTIKLDELVVPIGVSAGFVPVAVMVNQQDFTKTANCWGVTNQVKGTNTNRVVIFQKP